MKKNLLVIVFLFFLHQSYAQWHKVTAVPDSSIVAFTVHNNTMYAATNSNIVFKSSDGGITWNPIVVINDTIDISSIIFFNNTMYVGTYRFGVFFSSDNGATWHNNGKTPAQISGFAIHNNVLYASTQENGVAVLNTATNTWSFFNNNLPDYSAIVHSITSSPGFLLIAPGSNGTFYRYDFTTNSWHEEYYDGVLHPGVKIDKITSAGDTVIAVNFQRIIKSTNGGLNWTNDKVGTHDGISRSITAGVNSYYTLTNEFPRGTWIQQRNKQAAIGTSWAANEEFLTEGFAYTILEFSNKLFLGKADGLYVKSLSAENPLPVHVSLFSITCEDNKVALTWKTAQEQNSSHYAIERSVDAISWIAIGELPAAGNSVAEKTYGYTDNHPVANSYYRIAAYDLDGKIQYTGMIRSSCAVTDAFSLWPNPFHDNIFISIVAGGESQVSIKVFDSKGALVKAQQVRVLRGSNQISIETGALANGIYTISADLHNGQASKIIRAVKQ